MYSAFAQHVIKYEHDNNYKGLPDRVIFVDTVHNKEIKSFYASERNPYWNLPYPVADSGKDYKSFILENADSINYEQIPGYLLFESVPIHYRPDLAIINQGCILSSNNQFIIIKSNLYTYSEELWDGYANFIEIYKSDGTLLRSMTSNEGFTEALKISNDGKYLINRIIYTKSNILFPSDRSNRIVNLFTMEEIADINDSVYSIDSKLTKIYNGYICILGKSREPSKEFESDYIDMLICIEPEKRLMYIGRFPQKMLENIMDVSDDGVLFGVSENEFIPVFRSFKTDFKKDTIQ
jgi:hypothetical protein